MSLTRKPKIVLISGKKQSGKDTAADYLINLLSEQNISGITYSFATPLKNFLIDVFGLSYLQCWGSDLDKNTLTRVKWSDLPLPKDVINQIYFKSTQNFTHNIDEYMTARQVMETFGTHICRHMMNNCWAESARRHCTIPSIHDVVFITDARFPNELDVFKDLRPVILRLQRNLFNSQTDIETALDNYNFDSWVNYISINNQEWSIEEKNQYLKMFVLPKIMEMLVEIH